MKKRKLFYRDEQQQHKFDISKSGKIFRFFVGWRFDNFTGRIECCAEWTDPAAEKTTQKYCQK